MRELKFLNSKEKQHINHILNEQFGITHDLKYDIVINQKEKLYLITRNIDSIPMEKVRVNSIGLYFGEQQNNTIRLTIEGSQIIGPLATKNIISIDEKDASEWIKGNDFHADVQDGIYILKHQSDFIGCTKARDKKMLNFVPKNRRLKTINNE